MISLKSVLPFVYFVTSVSGYDPVVIVDASSPSSGHLKHFWSSTGLCPPEPHSEAYKFLLSADEVGNLALIAALPRAAVTQVRIHWLLDLVTVSSIKADGSPRFNFTYLDLLLDLLHERGLTPGFELMGNPSEFFKDFNDDVQVKHWRRLIRQTVVRYIDRYGDEYVSRWRFETWNEPDLTSYNIFNFTLPSFLRYFDACSEGLDVGRRHKRLGGPAGLFKSHDRHPLCWGLLEHCANSTRSSSGCKLDFISYHKKGGGTSSAIVQEGIQLARDLANRYPSLANVPLANDEADPLTGWSKSKPWRADVTYGALVSRVIADHQREFVRKRGLPLEVLSNDNAFLNYHPNYFTQRTLLARFQMNNTNPPHVQFFRKPVYSTMALLSYLGTKEIDVSVHNADERLSVLSAYNGDALEGDWDAAVLLTFSNDTESDDEIKIQAQVEIRNLPMGDACCKFTVYRLNNAATNPSAAWWRTGAEVFPDRAARRRIRDAEGPDRVVNIHDTAGVLRVVVELALPSVALVHVCVRPPALPGPVTHLRALNVTLHEVLLVWRDDQVVTPCIKTYEIEFLTKHRRGNDAGSRRFRRMNLADTIFLSYQHVVEMSQEMTAITYEDEAAGVYRVRAVDYWDRPGPYETITYP